MAFGEFQNVSVGILNEGNVILAAGPIGLGSESELHTFRFEFLTQFVEVGGVDGDVAVPLGHFLDVTRAAGFDELQSRIFVLRAIT